MNKVGLGLKYLITTAMLALGVAKSQEAIAQTFGGPTITIGDQIPSPQNPGLIRTHFSVDLGDIKGDPNTIALTNNTPNVAEMLNASLSADSSTLEGDFDFSPGGVTGSLSSAGAGVSINTDQLGYIDVALDADSATHRIISNPSGEIYSSTPIRIVGLARPDTSNIISNPIICDITGTPNGHVLQFSDFGPGTLMGSATVVINQGGNTRGPFSMPLDGRIEIPGSIQGPANVEVTPGDLDAKVKVRGPSNNPPIVYDINLPVVIDETIPFYAQNYSAVDSTTEVKVLFPNTTGDTIYYKVTPPIGSQHAVSTITVGPGETKHMNVPKLDALEMCAVVMASTPDFNPDDCFKLLADITIPALVADTTVASTDPVTPQRAKVKLFPNPTSSELNIEGVADYVKCFNFKIADEIGQIVGEGKGHRGPISVENLPQGIYMISVSDPTKPNEPPKPGQFIVR